MDGTSVASLRVARLGKILNNFAILGAVICLTSAAYFLLVAAYYIALICILLLTLFTILVTYPEFSNLFSNSEAINAAVMQLTTTYIPVIAPVTLILSAASVAALIVSKQKKNVGRIVINVLCFIVGAVFTALYSFAGGEK